MLEFLKTLLQTLPALNPHIGEFFFNVLNKLCFISLVYYVHNSWSCPRVLSCRNRGTFTSQNHKHPLLEGKVLSKCKKNRAQPPHQNYTTLNRFYSCCHFILWKWKVVFTGIKFSFYPRKKREKFCKNCKFPQQQLHKNVWSYPSGCLFTCLKWKAVCAHGWEYTHQKKLIMQIFAKWEQ